MGEWTIQERQEGGHEVLYLDDDISAAPLLPPSVTQCWSKRGVDLILSIA